MERPLITAVTHSRDEARLTLLGVPDHPGVAGRIFTALADANINVDMIIQDEPDDEGAEAHMSFTVPRTDLRDARAALDPVVAEVGIRAISEDPEMGKVSVVGAGMKSHPGVAAKVFTTLGEQGINIEMISTSPIKISCVVTADSVDRAVRALHEAFELGADQIEAEHPFGAPSMSHTRVAVVGATGAVGTVMRAKLRERGFPAETIVPFASERSEGRELDGVPCRVLSDESIQGFDIALFSAGATTSRAWAQKFVDAGAVVVDNSSAFRSDPEIPLVVSEVNPDALEGHQRPDREPELLDDAADGRAEADPRRGRHRPPDRLDLPVGLRHRRQGGQGARGPDARRAGRRAAPGRRRSTRTTSRSTCWAAPATSPTATTTPTKSAR